MNSVDRKAWREISAALDTATLSVLGYEREARVVHNWNEDAMLLPVPL